MIRHYGTTQKKEGNTTIFTYTNELIDAPCIICGCESVENRCKAHHKYHHHGMVHIYPEDLMMALCADCGRKAQK